MSLEQGRGHGQWVVEVGEGRVCKLGAGVEHALGGLFDGGAVFLAVFVAGIGPGFAKKQRPRFDFVPVKKHLKHPQSLPPQ